MLIPYGKYCHFNETFLDKECRGFKLLMQVVLPEYAWQMGNTRLSLFLLLLPIL